MTFSTLGLSAPITQAVNEKGYSSPTAIQQKAIPAVLAGRDLLATAQTGSGKTASFVLPILELLSGERKLRGKRIRALILVPTRELAMQVEANISDYGKHLNLRSMVMVGGVDAEPQKHGLIYGVDILVATPGRLLDMAHQRALYFDELELLVLDEADRMLDMGFIADINKIIERLPEQRQNLLFSATLSRQVRSLAKTAINKPVEVSIVADQNDANAIDQWLITVDKDTKSALLSHLIQNRQWTQALIFIRTKHGAAKLVSQLEKRGIKAESIHGGRSQAVRTQILADFKSGKIGMLVATGIAARGIDIDNLDRVVNYDLPDDADDYIHRIGRTGRAGASGEAVSLVSKDDFKRLCAIERRLEHLIERREIEGFEAKKVVPISILNYVKKTRSQ
ncbi:DEAD/DEAH box helicase [Oceanicoccus sagamiensis]|uniref:DEAD-box ATP-dependent RNA helicase RhpA n=1 Tax=Oceanicoccus sagamiensis TaxID=716816 RepID=A0A1X9N623_9GAMM|nr:DEAD/DEAH box helicase [Oceanicoccus sagamiensis]ARN73176.1 RNA helicase [Oceanicoccus sagamiensis]